MYKRCITAQSAQRQRQMEAALLAEMCHKPYEEITVSSLCDLMGVPRKSFYRYFTCKEGALHALVDHTLLDFAEALSVYNTGSSPLTTFEDFFAFWLDHEALLAALNRSGFSGILIERACSLSMSDNFFPMRLLESYHAGFSKKYIVLFFVSGLMSLIIEWYNSDFYESPTEMAAIASHLLTSSFYIPKSKE